MIIQNSKLKEAVNTADGEILLNRTIECQWEQSRSVSTEPTLFFKRDGTVFWVNPASLTFFGVSAGEILGQHLNEIVRRFQLRFSNCPYEPIGKNRAQNLRMMEYNGAWYTYRLEPVLGEDGVLRGFVARILDTRDEVCLQETTEQLQHLMAATDNAVMISGLNHQILRWNSGVEQVFGYQADDLEGKVIQDLISPPYRKIYAMHADRVLHDGVMQQFSIDSLTKSGEVVSVAVSMAPLHDPNGAVSGTMILSRDVTEEHGADMRLVQHMADTAVKITGPLSHMRSNLEEIVTALQDDLLTTEERVMFLTVLMKSIGYIEENLREMNRVAIDDLDGVPDEFRKYLCQ